MCVRPVMLLLVAFAAPFAKAQDGRFEWPQFRGPGGLGVGKAKALPANWSGTENIVWKVELTGPGTSSPVIHGPRIYLTSYSGYNVPGQPKGEQEQLRLHVHCLNRADGKPIWTKDIAPKLPEQDRIRDDHGYASSTPAIDADRLYVFFGKSGVYAFSHDGDQLWTADVGSKLNGWGMPIRRCSPATTSSSTPASRARLSSRSIARPERRPGKREA